MPRLRRHEGTVKLPERRCTAGLFAVAALTGTFRSVTLPNCPFPRPQVKCMKPEKRCAATTLVARGGVEPPTFRFSAAPDQMWLCSESLVFNDSTTSEDSLEPARTGEKGQDSGHSQTRNESQRRTTRTLDNNLAGVADVELAVWLPQDSLDGRLQLAG